jgi:putative transposase
MELNHMNHAVGQSAYHFVWRPKYNVSVFRTEFPRRVADEAIRQVAKNHKINIIELKVMPDHVHCFAEIPATISVSRALQILKGGSARIFFKKCTVWGLFFSRDGTKEAHLWSPGKFFRSVGSVKAEVIEEYIRYSQDEWNFDFKDIKQKQLG